MGKSIQAYATETWVLKKISSLSKSSVTTQVVSPKSTGLKINRDLTKEEYEALKAAGKTDPNTLYLIKKV